MTKCKNCDNVLPKESDIICDTCYIKDNEVIDGLTPVQHQALTKPCPKCNSKLDTVGDLSDFDHDIVVCTHCDYAMFADGSTMED